MPVIEFQTKHKAKGLYDYIVEDDDGMVADTVRIEAEETLVEGDLCTIYSCAYNGAPAVLKIARHAEDNDLVTNEINSLQVLNEGPNGKFHMYLPQVQISGTHEGKAFSVFKHYQKRHTIAEVLQAFPNGLDYRDAVWMYKRVLVGAGFAHGRGIIHGAILPSHVLINPEHHGARIIDWCYSVRAPTTKLDAKGIKASHIKAISNEYRAYYPPEVFEKKPAHPTIDIYMATKIMVALLGGNIATNEMPDKVPVELRRLLSTALVTDLRRRPQDAWNFHTTLDELLKNLVGEPKFRVFTMPKVSHA